MKPFPLTNKIFQVADFHVASTLVPIIDASVNTPQILYEDDKLMYFLNQLSLIFNSKYILVSSSTLDCKRKNSAHSINLCLLDQGEWSELARMNVAGKEQDAILLLGSVFQAAASSALVLTSWPDGLESCELFCSCIASMIIRCLRSSASNFWNQASMSSRGLNFRRDLDMNKLAGHWDL